MAVKENEFALQCLNYDMKILMPGVHPPLRQNNPYFYVEILTSLNHVGEFDVLFETELLDFGKLSESSANPKMKLWYPHDIPALLKVMWYNDTYCGVVLLKCLEKRGWVEFEVPFLENFTSTLTKDFWKTIDDNKTTARVFLEANAKNERHLKEASEKLENLDKYLAKSLRSLHLSLKFQHS